MKFTDIFIRRPVLASVVSLLILVLGLRALGTLQVLQYPQTQNAVVTITTVYYGADPDVVAGFITTPLENAVAQANGIDYMSSTSLSGVSTITVYLRLNYDADKALTEINTKINSVLSQLPQGTQQPTLTVRVGQTIDAMYIGFNSTVLAPNQITDYLVRVVQPRLQAVPGVQTAEILGQKNFALRAWLDPEKLAAYGLTAADVSAGAGSEQLHLGSRHHQGPDGADGPDRVHRPALAGRVPRPGAEAVGRRDRPAEGRRQRLPGLRRLRDRGRLRRPARGLYRRAGRAGSQPAGRGPRRARDLSRHPVAIAAGAERADRLRLRPTSSAARSTRWCARW